MTLAAEPKVIIFSADTMSTEGIAVCIQLLVCLHRISLAGEEAMYLQAADLFFYAL